MKFWVTALAVGTVCGCSPAVAPTASASAVDPSQGATAVALASSARGDPVDATVPLRGGGALSLASLRGKVVVVELFSPSEVGWTQQHRRWASLRAEYEADVEVVVVATASADGRLVHGWDTRPPAYRVGWDPEGALALRLGVPSLPTVVVLDRQGRQVATGSDRRTQRRAAVSLLSR